MDDDVHISTAKYLTEAACTAWDAFAALVLAASSNLCQSQH